MRRALAFLTPLGGASTPTPAALRAFPIIGAGLGAALGCIWWGAAQLWPRPVAAAIVVAADLALTGLLHVDGLADTADGLLPHLDRHRRLEVMAAPDVGAFGVSVVAVVVLVRWVALAAIAPSVPLLAGLWCASRTAMAVAALTQTYVGGGLATAFLPDDTERLVQGAGIGLFGVMLAVVLVLIWRVLPGLVVLAALAVAAAMVVGLARRRIGGFTGDVLGAAGVMAETVGLLVAAAKW